jgi:NADH-quinone oxidoreductase subunit L
MSETALNTVLIIGASTAFFMGLLGLVNNDIKRVVAYSTLSQLGYMTVALGVSAYAGAVFHLMTHAFFKALLFLAAGSVIIGMHHEQDMRKMGGLKKYMPITYWTSLIGSLALIGFPGTAGFFSKDALIEAVHESHLPAAGYAYFCVFAGVFITAFYSFRLVFMTFHGKERFSTEVHHGDLHEAAVANKVIAHDHHAHDTHAAHDHDSSHGADAHDEHHGHHGGPPHESPWVVTLPLILLAIPSLFIGWFTIGPMLFGDYFGSAIHVEEAHNVLGELAHEFHGPAQFVLHGVMAPPVWLALFGVFLAWLFYIKMPEIPGKIATTFAPLYKLFENKFYFDEIYFAVFAKGSINLGKSLWKVGDSVFIDGLLVNGSARAVGWFAGIIRGIQTGRLYSYAFTMIIGLAAMLYFFVLKR